MTDRPARPHLMLAMLLLAYSFNYLDRQILSILAEPVKTALHLTDEQLGMLGGLAFAILYSTLAIPLALVADRTSRAWTIALSLGVWSAFTALCGTAQGFGQMFLFRLGVGVGEAGGVAPSYALIGDLFPPDRRTRALSIYALGIPLGAAAGLLLGGYIAQAVDWRVAFLAVGGAGLVAALPFKLIVRDPPRARGARVPVSQVFAILAAKPSFWLLSGGATAGSVVGYGIGFWLPSLLQRSFGLDRLQSGQFYAGLLLTGGVAGVLLGGWLGDRLGRGRHGWYALAPAIGYAATAPLFAAGLLMAHPLPAFAIFLLPQLLSSIWLPPVVTAIQHLVPPQMRATAAASFLLINNLVGLGLGSWSIGALSDALTPRYGTAALAFAVGAALLWYVVAAALMLLASRTLPRDWVD